MKQYLKCTIVVNENHETLCKIIRTSHCAVKHYMHRPYFIKMTISTILKPLSAPITKYKVYYIFVMQW